MTRTIQICTFALAAMIGLVALVGGADAARERNGIYAVGGNQFIVRTRQSGSTLYLRLYRRAGDQWEPYARGSMPADDLEYRRERARNGYARGLAERIFFTGRLIGYTTIDLDNPINTHLNRGNGRCLRC